MKTKAKIRVYLAVRLWKTIEIEFDGPLKGSDGYQTDAANDAISNAVPLNQEEWDDCEIDEEENTLISAEEIA